jgi:hypothetical protein
MKIGIIISGHCRSFEQTYQSFNNCFQNYNHVFISTYNEITHQDKVWWNNSFEKDKSLITINSEILDRYYRPRKIKIIKQENYKSDIELYNTIGGYNAIHNMWNSILNSYKLLQQYERENNIKFDIIIRTRFDLEYLNTINKQELESLINKNILYLLPTPHSRSSKLYSDMFFICRNETFKKILNFNNVMDKYLQISIDKHNIIEGEQPFTKYIKDNDNLSCYIKYSDLKCNLVRIDGSKHILF